MFDTVEFVELTFVVLGFIGTLVGVWVNLNTDITKLKSRVYHLEQSDLELKATLSDILAKLQHIEIMLAENQIRRKD